MNKLKLSRFIQLHKNRFILLFTLIVLAAIAYLVWLVEHFSRPSQEQFPTSLLYTDSCEQIRYPLMHRYCSLSPELTIEADTQLTTYTFLFPIVFYRYEGEEAPEKLTNPKVQIRLINSAPIIDKSVIFSEDVYEIGRSGGDYAVTEGTINRTSEYIKENPNAVIELEPFPDTPAQLVMFGLSTKKRDFSLHPLGTIVTIDLFDIYQRLKGISIEEEFAQKKSIGFRFAVEFSSSTLLIPESGNTFVTSLIVSDLTSNSRLPTPLKFVYRDEDLLPKVNDSFSIYTPDSQTRLLNSMYPFSKKGKNTVIPGSVKSKQDFFNAAVNELVIKKTLFSIEIFAAIGLALFGYAMGVLFEIIQDAIAPTKGIE